MKYFQRKDAASKDVDVKNCDTPDEHKTSDPSKTLRSVHFPNDVVFQDCVRQGELDRIGGFMRTRRVSLETIYHSGMAAIHEAVLSGNLDCVQLLLKFGADIHQRDEEGWTPLHMSCSDGFPHIARYLLSQGADPTLENECGEKPADLIEPDHKELLEIFGVAVSD
ncbi:protein phosphatase 1 regulatory subunit 27b [Genypterus blacodes]|uniref:protein phosphatase 1 regulatory subunit 27b n=1 Tax=Genypterus blacodes TaxID=154954 RepID=UPI003F7659FA